MNDGNFSSKDVKTFVNLFRLLAKWREDEKKSNMRSKKSTQIERSNPKSFSKNKVMCDKTEVTSGRIEADDSKYGLDAKKF